MRRIRVSKTLPDSGPQRWPGKIKPSLPSLAISSRIASARDESGTRCSTPPFMHTAGIVHTLASRSISSQRAPVISPVTDRAKHLARPVSVENDELEAARRYAVDSAQAPDELGHFSPRHGRK